MPALVAEKRNGARRTPVVRRCEMRETISTILRPAAILKPGCMRVARFLSVGILALWVPLGPCASIAAAWVHAKPCCQSQKLGCHGGDCAKKLEAAADRGCQCHGRTELKNGVCPCGHDNAGLTLHADPIQLPVSTRTAPLGVAPFVAAKRETPAGMDRRPEIQPPIALS